jgi:hypothetical protein
LPATATTPAFELIPSTPIGRNERWRRHSQFLFPKCRW